MYRIRLLLFFITVLCSSIAYAQVAGITISGLIKNKTNKLALSYVNVLARTEKDTAFVAGTITNEEGRFSLTGIKPGNYQLEFSLSGFRKQRQPLFVGSLSEFLEIPPIELEQEADKETKIEEVVLTASKKNEVSNQLDKKTYSVADNISQSGGSVLQSMQNLPGVTVQDGKVQLRGNDKVTVLIDGKQTALTGFGSQSGLDNIRLLRLIKSRLSTIRLQNMMPTEMPESSILL